MSKRRMITLIVPLLLSSSACLAHGQEAQKIEPAARQQIDAGNQAWIDGMKQGKAAPIAATYTADAVDCGPAGECIRGRAAIEQHIKEGLAKRGRAQSASVQSVGSVQQGSFVYEWGQADATFARGIVVTDRYLTAWQKQPDGTWKIFRNLVIPDK